MGKDSEFDSLTKEDIEDLFLRKKTAGGKVQRLKVFCLDGAKANFVTFTDKDVQRLSENPENFRLIDIKLKQKASNKKKPRTYLIRITRPTNKEPQQVLVLLSGAKRKIKGLS